MNKITFFIQTLQLTFTFIGLSAFMNVVLAQPLEVVTTKNGGAQNADSRNYL
jgi:hypothetical protein